MASIITTFLVNLWRRLGNLWRWLLRRRVDYVRIDLGGALPEFAEAPPWWQRRLMGRRAPLSMQELRRRLDRIAADPQAKGLLLHIDGLAVGWATLQSLRAELLRFRAAGGRVVAYVASLDNASYCAACAADTIVTVPSAEFRVLGLRLEVQFLGDALDRIGLRAEVEAVSPYKSAGDQFSRSDMSPEDRAQLERVLDGRYAALVEMIAEGRAKQPEEVRALIDAAPMGAQQALDRGLVDQLCYEDELEALLRVDGRDPVIAPWHTARRALRLPLARAFRRVVAVVPVEGAIVTGGSRSLPVPLPLLGEEFAGAESVSRALRQAERSQRVAAVLVYVNSRGGDAFASDLIWREVLRVGRRKPLVVVMGDVAASGGYYLAAPAAAIVARPATLTGSIGVIATRFAAADLLGDAGVNTVVLSRGAHTGLGSATEPLSEAERAALREEVQRLYAIFKQRVRDGRGLSEERLEPIAGGRVWLGHEARDLGLVDLLGGVPEGLLRAQELAGLPQDRAAPLLLLRGGPPQPPQPFPAALADLRRLLSDSLRSRLWMLLPYEGL